MGVRIDRETDTLYFRLDEARIVDSEEIKPGIILDYDGDNRVVGIEFLHISHRASQEQLSSMLFETV